VIFYYIRVIKYLEYHGPHDRRSQATLTILLTAWQTHHLSRTTPDRMLHCFDCVNYTSDASAIQLQNKVPHPLVIKFDNWFQMLPPFSSCKFKWITTDGKVMRSNEVMTRYSSPSPISQQTRPKPTNLNQVCRIIFAYHRSYNFTLPNHSWLQTDMMAHFLVFTSCSDCMQ